MVTAPPQVETQPDGVHIRIESSIVGTDSEVFFYAKGDVIDGAGNDSWGVGLTPGEDASAVLPIPPGRVQVGCFTTPFNVAEVSPSDFRTVDVVDTAGNWKPFEPDCDAKAVAGVLRMNTGESRESGLRRALTGVEDDDAIDEAGYANFKRYTVYSVTRQGRRIAHLRVNNAPTDTFGISGEACPDSEIGVRSYPAPAS